MNNREPLALRAAIILTAATTVHLAIVMGWTGISSAQETALVTWVDVMLGLVYVIWARAAVTPVADPRNDAGQPLIPAP